MNEAASLFHDARHGHAGRSALSCLRIVAARKVHLNSATTVERTLFRKHIAWPQQHGAWALWLGPFLVGAILGGRPTLGLAWLTVAMLGVFLLQQPLTILVKTLAGRRLAEERRPALFWLAVYGGMAACGAAGLALTGNGAVLWLGVFGAPALLWQLALVAQRAERGQMWAEVLGAAALALSAPAAQAVGAGGFSRMSWILGSLCALQAAGAIRYVYACLSYRRLKSQPDWAARWRLAGPALFWNGLALLGAAGLAAVRWAPPGAWLGFALMLGETLYGGLVRPPVGVKPVVIGVRQTVVTGLFSLALIWAYRAA